MKLKKIIIQGFKSFADKTEINFKDGVTAIVGPNGSGKSNISDAIRWVLGEQSVKTLRGAKMEDIIFAGTDKRKALGYAEVTIIFNNDMGKIPIDYKEVAVTRRMFRSGESEYYLNKNSCRLKDIRELFMDTGIGKDGYSIIGQGRIDEILSNRPEDRRSIFEEAAGIVKYKSKKQEAERKLEKTEENNSRIKDIIFELEKRKTGLEKESEKAIDYREKFNRLKEVETSVYYYEIDRALEQINNFSEEKIKISDRYNKSIKAKEEILKEFDLSKGKIEENNLELEDIRNKKDEISKEVDKKNNQILILREKENYSNKELKRLEDEKKTLIDFMGSIGRELVSLEKNLVEMQKNFEEESKAYDGKGLVVTERVEELKILEVKIEQEKNILISTYNKLSDLKSELNGIKSFRANIFNRIEKINKELEVIKLEEEKIEQDYLLLKSSNENIENEKSELKENYEKTILDKEKLSEYIKELDMEINKYRNTLSSKSSNFSMLKNMEETYDGYYKGVKEVLKEAERNNKIKEGFLGVVAEVFSVDGKYEIAVETALGSNAQNIITKDEYFGKIIIEYLRSNRLGRVTCLPINIIRGNTIDLSSINFKEFGVLGLASDLIKYDELYENIFKNLLGRTIIVDTMDNGIKLSRATNQRYRIVTLDGSILNPGGSMSGGSRLGGNTGIIGRKNRIDELELEIQGLSNEVNSLERLKNEKLLNLSEMDRAISSLLDDIKTNDYNNIELKNNLENSLRDHERLSKSIENQEKEKMVLEEELSKQEDNMKKIEFNIIEIENEIKSRNDNIELLNGELTSNKESNDEDLRLYTEFRIELNKKKNNIENNIRDIDIKKNTLKNRKESVLNIDSKIEEIVFEIEEITKEINFLEAELLKNKNIEKLIKESLNGKTLENKELLESFYLEQEKLNEINDLVSKNENDLRDLELEINKMNLLKENNIKKLLEDYEIDYLECEERVINELDLKTSKEEVKDLKKYIRNLGTINLGSIEEFTAVDERLGFMIEQKNDLEKAKKDLDRVIVDMEKKMKVQFKECFDEINENFKDIFKVLFNGGKAELILENPEDILNTGIDVKAQPPGKKQQSLSLLSGGERSLTAVALLFAMLEMRPSPFCILDEIDAALDEANIGRYTNYLSSFGDNTQFVMITHRKTTMEMADVLYGVTMEEDGVSKILSVELSDKEKIEKIVS